jgi:hypothetical protein
MGPVASDCPWVLPSALAVRSPHFLQAPWLRHPGRQVRQVLVQPGANRRSRAIWLGLAL